MKLPIYLDYMATTPVDPRVAKKMSEYLTIDGNFGNPSSQHFYGYHAKAAIENAQEQVASLINADPRGIIWTSGATESDNLAIKGSALFYQRQGKHIITCKTEHKAVLDSCQYLASKGFTITYLDPKSDGLIDLKQLESAIQKDTILISIMHVNNEIGVIQDINAISEIARSRGIIFHVDAAQSVGKIAIDLQKTKVDLMSFSAHKIYGPKGIGALYVRQNPRLHLEPQIHGGQHQHGLRSGTLATHQIVGMGEAFAVAHQELPSDQQRIWQLRQRLWHGINDLGKITLNGSQEHRVAANLNISVADIDNELLLSGLKDLALSSAATCLQAAMEPSYVLKALGLNNQLASRAIRFSLGRFTTEAEIDYAIKHLRQVITKLRM